MSNYYDSLAQDLPPMMGVEPIDATQYGPQQPPMADGNATPIFAPTPPPNIRQPASPNGLPLPPPMPGGGRPMQDDPFNKALTQSNTATQMFSPTAPGIGYQPGGQPPTHPPANLYPPVPPPLPPRGPPGAEQAGGPPPGMTSGAGGPSVPFGPSTDWATATGLAPTGQDRMTSALGGLGKGLSAAAGNSNKAGAVFSRGAGGAITGQINEAQEQQKLKLGLRNEYFNQTSKAFQNAMLQKSTDSKDLYWQSRAQQYLATAKLNGGKAQPWNADQLALAKAEDEARKNYASDRADLNTQKGQLPPDEWVKRFDALQQGKGKYFQDAYKKYGVDPEKAENLKTQGMKIEKPFSQVKTGDWYIDPTGKAVKKTSGDTSYAPGDTVKWINPIDASKMDVNGFHQTVPDQAYYTTKAGLHQRTVPPPMSADPRQLQQQIQQAEQEENFTGGPE